MSSKRPTFKQLKAKALKKPGVREAYDALSPAYEVKRQLIAMRKNADMTQEELAELLGTKKSSISRLESMNADNSPTLSTIEDYAKALGFTFRVEFEKELTS